MDVTSKIIITDEDLQEVAKVTPLAGGFIRDFSRFYLAFHHSEGLDGFYVHDPSTLFYIEQSELFKTKTAAIQVVTEGIAIGQTIAAFPPQSERLAAWKNVKMNQYADRVDSEGARQLLLKRFKQIQLVK